MHIFSKRNNVAVITFYIILVLLALACLIPFYNIFINATWDNATITSSYKLVPGKYLLANYNQLTSYTSVSRSFYNSAIIAVSCTVLSSYFGALTAYGFAKFKFRFNKALFWIVLGTMMLPAMLGIIGYYQLMNKLHLLDNYLSLILPSIACPSAVFFIRQYINSCLSDSLIESGRIDGCGELKIFHEIVFPIIIPAVATQAIFIFVASWNNFMSPLILLFSPEKFTLPVVIQQLAGTHYNNYGVVYLGIAISTIPVMIVFSLCSRQIIGGLTMGSVKE